MKRKPIKIDWEELEDAFNSPPEEISSYLDGISGHVALEGEGEEDDLEDEYAIYRSDLLDDEHPGLHNSAKLTQVLIDLLQERTGPLVA